MNTGKSGRWPTYLVLFLFLCVGDVAFDLFPKLPREIVTHAILWGSIRAATVTSVVLLFGYSRRKNRSNL